MAALPKCLSFKDVVEDGKEAFVRVTEDGLIYAVDLVMVVTGKDRNHAAYALSSVPEELFQQAKYYTRSLPGKGNGKTKLMSFQDAIELIMVLPGKLSKACRKKMTGVITRYLDGDTTLVDEIAENGKIGQVKSYLNFAQKVLGDMEEEQERHEISHGYVYAFESTAFPGLFKIGRSKNIKRRLSELNTACAPAPLKVIATAPSYNPSRDEKLAHEHFAEHHEAGEFFKVTLDDIKQYFKTVITAKFYEEVGQKTAAMSGLVF